MSGDDIKAWRFHNHISQMRLAALCGVSHATVSNWEHLPELPLKVEAQVKAGMTAAAPSSASVSTAPVLQQEPAPTT